jgi:hypothetical protein
MHARGPLSELAWRNDRRCTTLAAGPSLASSAAITLSMRMPAQEACTRARAASTSGSSGMVAEPCRVDHPRGCACARGWGEGRGTGRSRLPAPPPPPPTHPPTQKRTRAAACCGPVLHHRSPLRRLYSGCSLCGQEVFSWQGGTRRRRSFAQRLPALGLSQRQLVCALALFQLWPCTARASSIVNPEATMRVSMSCIPKDWMLKNFEISTA